MRTVRITIANLEGVKSAATEREWRTARLRPGLVGECLTATVRASGFHRERRFPCHAPLTMDNDV